MPEQTILFYNDSEVFGGHEIMTVRILNSLASLGKYTLHCLHHAPDFVRHLDPAIQTHTLPFHTKCLNPFMPGTGRWQTAHIRDLIRGCAPDLMIVSQGYAESGVRGLMAARRAGVPCYSYIPFGNNNAELNNRFALARDWICKSIYGLPEGYLTISRYQATLLRRFTRGDQPIHVINNPADFDYATPEDTARYAPKAQLEIAVTGRIVFKQKNQQALIPMARMLTKHVRFRIHIIGDGPDRPKLERLIAQAGLSDQFVIHGWMQKPELIPFLSQHVDLMLIPSLYEGLPLILLEALYLNKAFLISDLGLLDDYAVPHEWTFDPRRPETMAVRIADLPRHFDANTFAALRHRVLEQHSSARFHREVADVFDSLLGHHSLS